MDDLKSDKTDLEDLIDQKDSELLDAQGTISNLKDDLRSAWEKARS